MKVTFVLDGRLLQYSSVNFITAFGGNKSTGLLTIHIEEGLSYITIEARDSLHFLKDCKKTSEVDIVLFTTTN